MTLEQDCQAVLARDLGPAASAFLNRQCKNRLKKEPARLKKTDLDELAKWCAFGLQPILGANVAENAKKGILALK